MSKLFLELGALQYYKKLVYTHILSEDAITLTKTVNEWQAALWSTYDQLTKSTKVTSCNCHNLAMLQVNKNMSWSLAAVSWGDDT